MATTRSRGTHRGCAAARSTAFVDDERLIGQIVKAHAPLADERMPRRSDQAPAHRKQLVIVEFGRRFIGRRDADCHLGIVPQRFFDLQLVHRADAHVDVGAALRKSFSMSMRRYRVRYWLAATRISRGPVSTSTCGRAHAPARGTRWRVAGSDGPDRSAPLFDAGRGSCGRARRRALLE